MSDLLTPFLSVGSFVREQWPWVAVGLLTLFWVWFRNTVCALPSTSFRVERRS
jgi:hypothetical protein